MKFLYGSIFLLFFGFNANAQGTIIGFSMSPTTVVSTDTIYIYADLRFPSSNCELDVQSHNVTGLTIQAEAHHCLGLLTAICSTVDTFKINPLPEGIYSFDLGLTSGAAPVPCTPGVVQDDDSTFTFTVGVASIADPNNQPFTIFPNPVVNFISLSTIENGTPYQIISIAGQVAKSGSVKNNQINHLGELSTGIYFLKLETPTGTIVRRIAKQ